MASPIPDPFGSLAKEIPLMRRLLKHAWDALDALRAGDPPTSTDWQLAEQVLEAIEHGGYVPKREA